MSETPATLPHASPTVSYWSARARNSDLIGHQSPAGVPSEADCVIIGSGMSGSLIAYFLLSTQPYASSRHEVVLLEAREAISAATACNGGHCRPDCYRGYSGYKKLHGAAQAMKIIENEMDTLNLVEQLVKEERIDCDFWRGRSFDAMMTHECKADYRQSYDEFVRDGGHAQQVDWIENEEQAKLKTRLKHVKAAASFPAGSFYPYNFTAHLLRRALSYGLNLQTNTPCTRVTPVEDNSWLVETPRGNIRARRVVNATNAYASAIFPEFVGKIIPLYGQCSSVTPTKSFSGKDMLSHTMSLYHERGDSDYIIQRYADGTVIVGGGEFIDRQAHINNCDDSVVIPAITAHLRGVMRENFEGWGEESVGEGLERTWCGIQGYTGDSLPYIGPFPQKEGLFVCAGFHGHGMARIATCARGVAMLLQGSDWVETGLPECFQITKERLSHPVRL